MSPELIERALSLVKGHPECFWFRHPEARIRTGADIRLVVEHLREYGDRRAWRAAQELHQCLLPHCKGTPWPSSPEIGARRVILRGELC